ncbi:MAG: type II toxin-antitoxin system VapC family toxin [Candidatus Micrarchaeota archaeon]|nr:type II toxin-antitoxin system VapC family toxin [Candidatus Micrarchaeota archaeon]
MIFLDTDILIDYLENVPSAVSKLDIYIGKDEKLVITDLTLGELAYIVQDRNILEEILEAFPVIGMDSKASMELVHIMKEFQFSQPPKFRYLYNAAIVIANDSHLITKNKQGYHNISGLRFL